MTFLRFLRSRDPYDLRWLGALCALCTVLCLTSTLWLYAGQRLTALVAAAGAALLANFALSELQNLRKQYQEEKDLQSER